MKISVILPTRNRAEPLIDTIKSLFDNLSKDNDIEILLRFDDDDLDTVVAVKKLIGKEENRIKYFIGPRYGYSGADRYYIELASKASGDWLFIFNDDSIMLTKNWDKEIEKYNGQLVIWPSLFPIMPRRVFEILGHIGKTSRADTWTEDVVEKLKKIGYQINIDLPISIGHCRPEYDRASNFEGKEYQPEYFSLENELLRIHDVEILVKYIDDGKIINNEFIEEFEKRKSDKALFHHDDQINLQKMEYELLTKYKPEAIRYSLFKLLCYLIPFRHSTPHIFTLLRLARYSKVGILEIGTGQGEGTIALGMGSKIYSVRGNKSGNNICEKLITVDVIQPENQTKGYFELFKEFLPSDCRIITGDPMTFSFNEPIDLLFINRSDTFENIYSICNKYIPLIVKDGIVIFTNTGSTDVISAVTRFLSENEDIKYELLPFDSINSHPKFLYNNVSMCSMRIL